MTIQLVDQTSDADSGAALAPFYDSRLIAPEKKPFLVDLHQSFGPFLAIKGTDRFILDACSQIASLGLGFNSSVYFGCTQHRESWTGDWQTDNVSNIRDAYSNLLIRQVHQGLAKPYRVQFCSSGAESIEIALGACFDAAPAKARKVLAFEGAFHGRMMVALSATWNPKKREPFAWPGYESVFVPYPAMDDDDIHGPEIPAGWIDRWAKSSEVGARHTLAPPAQEDSLLNREVATLMAIDQYLKAGEIFAILIEPMQCEGGDRYSSARFHQALINLADSYDVPLIYDEIQTGLRLGKTFFWHQQFGLRDCIDHPVSPSIVVSAKKAQVGFLVSRLPLKYRERFCPASLFRGYAVASTLDQFDEKIDELEIKIRQGLDRLVDVHSEFIHRPRGQGMAFAFDFKDEKHLVDFVAARFRHGLLFYSAGSHTARFRLNLAFGDEELQLLWQQLDQCLTEATSENSEPGSATAAIELKPRIEPQKIYDLYAKMALQKSGARPLDEADIRSFIAQNMEEEVNIVFLDKNNYPDYRARIVQMQSEVYEPARQTPPEEFDLLFKDDSSIEACAILVLRNERIIGMGLCGPLHNFQQERGVTSDPFFETPNIFYMVDLTIEESFRGAGLGRTIKSAIAMLAKSKGVVAIHGRNRDRMARGMWAINLSNGSYEIQHLVDDYPDNEKHRNCIYYRSPLAWNDERSEGSKEFLPLGQTRSELSEQFVARNMPALTNKLCLSNFVTHEFLDDLNTVTKTLPESLRHVYTASSLSESVDKVSKAIWVHRAPRTRLLTITGSYFGETSFLTRSLSGVGRAYFDTLRLPKSNMVSALQSAMQIDDWLAFYLDLNLPGLDDDMIAETIHCCRERGVPVVVNETGPLFGTEGQYTRRFADQVELLPDAGVAWLGGQMALSYTTDQLFSDKPLMLISTWDGDAYALARYAEAMRQQEAREPQNAQSQHQSI